MKKIVILIFLSLFLFASGCENKFFSYSNSSNQKERLSIDSFLKLLLTQKCNINIVYKDAVAKKIAKEKMPYMRIKNFTLNQILNLILTQKNLFYTLKNNSIEISYFKTKTYKINFISASRSGSSNLNATDNTVTNTYDFDFWGKLKNQIATLLMSNLTIDPNYKLLDKANFPPIVDKDTGLVVVTGTMKQLNAVDEYIINLRHNLQKEVLIDVHMYSVELASSNQTGIDWSSLSLNMNRQNVPLKGKYIGGSLSVFNSATFSISGLLNFLATNGNVNSISNPKIMTLNNQKAIISVGNTIYYKYASSVVTDKNGNPTTQYTINSKFVGIVLDITPQISDNGNIVLSIQPTLSAFRDLTQLDNINRGMPPDTKDNTMLSIVRLKNNQTLVLGGLITTDTQLRANGIPVLKEIPVIKYLFSSKSKVTDKKELVFVITPHIINLNKQKTLRDLGFGKIY